MRFLSIVFGPAKYTFVTSGWRGDIRKNGPRIVYFSMLCAETASWKEASSAMAVTTGGNRENAFNVCFQL
jgi:hypothetical protein